MEINMNRLGGQPKYARPEVQYEGQIPGAGRAESDGLSRGGIPATYTPAAIPPHTPGQPIAVNHGASGIGDALLGRCAVEGLRRESGEQAEYRVSRAAVPWVELWDTLTGLGEHDADTIGGLTRDVPLRARAGDRQLNQGYNAECASHAATPRWQRYCTNIGCTFPALPALRNRDALQRQGGQYAGAIALAPQTRPDGRAWPLRHWDSLWQLLTTAGHRVVLLGELGDGIHRLPGDRLVGAQPAEVVACLLNCSCIVGGDSGIAHVAGVLERPCVVLSGVSMAGQVHGWYPRSIWVRGSLICDGCWWQSPFRRSDCLPHCPSLATITPERVADAVDVAVRLAGLDLDSDQGVGGVRPDRRHTMTAFCRHILSRPNPLIVETGCQRASPDPGTGESTRLLGLSAAAAGGVLHSIDSTHEHVQFARKICVDLPVHVQEGMAGPRLRNYRGRPIDALYLDSADTWTPHYQQVCLEEARAAVASLAEDAVILIDDTVPCPAGWNGKGELAVPWLVSEGWTVVSTGYQVLLRRGGAA